MKRWDRTRVPRTPPLPAEILRPIRRLRFALRAWAILEGAALVVIGSVVCWLLSLALDYWVEPGLAARRWLLALLAGGLIALVGRFLLWRMTGRLRNRDVALLIERRFPALGDRLMTAVELQGQTHPFSRTMTEAAATEAGERLRNFRASDLIDRRRVVRRWGIGLGLALAAVALAWSQRDVTEVWYRRNIELANVRYPRSTHLTLVGFEGVERKVARGRDFELLIDADPTGVVPEKVSVRYRMEESGMRGRAYMTKVGQNRFRFEFRSVLEPIALEVWGGDDRTELVRLITVEPPRLEKIDIAATYPEYTGLPPAVLQVAGAPISLPVGSRVALSIVSSKPLAWLRCSHGEVELPTQRTGDASYSAAFTLAENMPIQVTLEDRDAIATEDPFPVDLVAVADEPPRIEASLRGVTQSITRMARVPLQLRIADDYGVARLSFEKTVDTSAPDQTAIEVEWADREAKNYEGLATFDVLPLQLQPGAKLALSVVAVDGENLNGPHEGRSEAFRFEIVTPEDLLAKIATRELNLRQQFEQIVRELQEARKSLGDLRAQLSDTSEKVVALRRLHVERAVQTIRKNANETGGLATGFREILAELNNNRVGNPAMLERLEQGITLPLEGLIVVDFPHVDQSLEQLRESLLTNAVGQRLSDSEAGMDKLLVRCDEVLRAMLKLENFNEVVAMLRSMIEDQEDVLQKTRDERKKKILDLLK